MASRFQKSSCWGAFSLPVSLGLFALLAAVPALAQKDPKFDFGKPEDVKLVEWKAQAKGGFGITTGNSQTQNGTLAANVSRKEGGNKLALEAGGAYGRATNRTFSVDSVANTYTVQPQSVTSTDNYYGKGRYDRFFTANNAGYASG